MSCFSFSDSELPCHGVFRKNAKQILVCIWPLVLLSLFAPNSQNTNCCQGETFLTRADASSRQFHAAQSEFTSNCVFTLIV